MNRGFSCIMTVTTAMVHDISYVSYLWDCHRTLSWYGLWCDGLELQQGIVEEFIGVCCAVIYTEES